MAHFRTARFSSGCRVWFSPNEPHTIRPDTPDSISASKWRAVAIRSSDWSSCNWVVTAGKTPDHFGATMELGMPDRGAAESGCLGAKPRRNDVLRTIQLTGPRSVSLPELRRRHTRHGTEGAGERAVVVEATRQRDLGHARSCFAEETRRGGDAGFRDELHRRDA